MKEKNLLAELAAYLFSRSDTETGRTPSERELAEHFARQPRPDPRGAGHPRSHAHRRAPGQVRHLPDHQAGERRGDGAVRPGRRAARPDPDLRDGRTAQDPRDQGGRARLLARHRREFRTAARDPEGVRRAHRRRRRPRQGRPRIPSGDRAGDQEQRLPQDLQRLLRDGRAAPADLFQRSRARPALACRAPADLRGAAAPRRQSRPGADERASAGRGELLEGPDRAAGGTEPRSPTLEKA